MIVEKQLHKPLKDIFRDGSNELILKWAEILKKYDTQKASRDKISENLNKKIGTNYSIKGAKNRQKNTVFRKAGSSPKT